MHIDYTEEDKLKAEYAHIKYTGDICKNCGRQRVELLANGKKICEKCRRNQDTNKLNANN